MRALRIDKTGSMEALYIAVLTKPEPRDGEALIRIEAAAINPSDVKNVQGVMDFTTTPRTPGRDFAGVVEAGPTEWVGKRVWGSGGLYGFTTDGAHAEYIVRPVDTIAEAPSNLSAADAAACGVPFVTAVQALTEASLTSSDTVAIIGAAGSVGGSAVQLAVKAGAKVFGVVRSDDQASTVESAGATPIVVGGSTSLPAAIRAANGGEGVTLIFDTVGGSMLQPALLSLAARGRLVEITAPQREVTFDLLAFYREDLRLIGVNTLNTPAADCAVVLARLRPDFESGALKPPSIGARYRLEEAPQAYLAAASGKVGKVIIEMG